MPSCQSPFTWDRIQTYPIPKTDKGEFFVYDFDGSSAWGIGHEFGTTWVSMPIFLWRNWDTWRESIIVFTVVLLLLLLLLLEDLTVKADSAAASFFPSRYASFLQHTSSPWVDLNLRCIQKLYWGRFVFSLFILNRTIEICWRWVPFRWFLFWGKKRWVWLISDCNPRNLRHVFFTQMACGQ